MALLGLVLGFAQAADPVQTHIPSGSNLEASLTALSPAAYDQAMRTLDGMHISESDGRLMRATPDGVYIYCPIEPGLAAAVPAARATASANGPSAAGIQPVLHSRSSSTRKIFLDFNGHTVTGTGWNDPTGYPTGFQYYGQTTINCVAFSLDADRTAFSAADLTFISEVWARVAEDYAPFDVDVTTDESVTFGPQVARVLITTLRDASGNPNPYSINTTVTPSVIEASGVAYVNAFGAFAYDGTQNTRLGPAFVYYDAFSTVREDLTAEVASHEVGHNMGLRHHGVSGGAEYYSGHGTGATSWGPIMGSGYNRELSQWSKGEYANPSRGSQDDLTLIALKAPVITDDAGGTTATAVPLTVATTGVVTVPAPLGTVALGTNTAAYVISSSNDVDMFSFDSGAGAITFTATTPVRAARTRGSNLQADLSILTPTGTVVATQTGNGSLPTTLSTTLVTGGSYILAVRGGSFGTLSTTGYSTYGNLGEYALSGTVVAQVPLTITHAPTGTVTSTTPITFTFTFGFAVTGFDASDITVVNGVAGAFSGTGTTYTLVVTPSGDGAVQVIVASNVAVAVVGGNPNAAGTDSIIFDTTRPQPVITPATGAVNQDPYAFTVNFGETVTGFDATDIVLTQGTLVSITGSGATYTVTVRSVNKLTIAWSIVDSAAVDGAGNTSRTASTSVSVDDIRPTVTMSVKSLDVIFAKAVIEVVSSEPMVGLAQSDFTVAGGVALALTNKSSTSWELEVGVFRGASAITLPDGTATDLAGNQVIGTTISFSTPIPVGDSEDKCGLSGLGVLFIGGLMLIGRRRRR